MDIDILDFENPKERVKIFNLMQQNILRNNHLGLKKLSNKIIDFAVQSKDKDLMHPAYLSYMLYKVLTQPHIVKSRRWKHTKELILAKIETLERDNKNNYEAGLHNFINSFHNSDLDTYKYLKNIYKKAKIKATSRIVSLGLSIKKAIEYTHADISEVREYISNTKTTHYRFTKEEISDKLKIMESKYDKELNIIFDSSTLISLGNACLFGTLVKLKKKYPNINFIIPKGVYEESITNAQKINRFSWNAARIKRLTNHKVIEVKNVESEGYAHLEDSLNKIFKTKYGHLEILQKGEIETLILVKDIPNSILAVDEYTTRNIVEDKKMLKESMERRHRSKIMVDNLRLKTHIDEFSNINIVRSVDIIAFAHKKDLFSEYDKQDILRSVLYALKYGGCGTSFEEIEEYVKKQEK